MPSVRSAVAEGYAYLDLLTAVDRRDSFEIVLRLVCLEENRASTTSEPSEGLRTRSSGPSERWLRTSVDRMAPMVDSLTDVLPAASWHEREIHEMFGIDFAGHPDLRPLLLTAGVVNPLRKETPLRARLETPWPGQSGATTGRRAAAPPGVPREWTREGA